MFKDVPIRGFGTPRGCAVNQQYPKVLLHPVVAFRIVRNENT